jgi:hypothetical protein
MIFWRYPNNLLFSFSLFLTSLRQMDSNATEVAPISPVILAYYPDTVERQIIRALMAGHHPRQQAQVFGEADENGKREKEREKK